MKRYGMLIFVLMMVSGVVWAGDLDYCPSPVDNPLKGVVPYVQQYPHGRFPHSMEFHYFSLRQLMGRTADGGQFDYTYDWSAIDTMLETVTGRGCQLVFRVYLEYPGQPVGVSQFLIDDGVAIKRWNHPAENKENLTPDYEDMRLRKAMAAFIAALGKRYDGDRRVAFITAGMLGKWGEWHTWPHDELFASIQVQEEVMAAFEKAFKTTPVMLRYPSGDNTSRHAANDERSLGYHDDSFAWATLKTGRSEDSWFFMALLENAGDGAMNKWKQFPIGGEIRPELWPTLFTDKPHPKQQDFDQCVQQTHVTWLMDTGLASPKYELSDERRRRAMESIRRMGYEFHITRSRSQWKSQTFRVELDVENRGVAPFYYNWPVEIALLELGSYRVLGKWEMPWELKQVSFSEVTCWDSGALTLDGQVSNDKALVAVRILNPCKGCKPLRFANCYRPSVPDYWLIVDEVMP